ncbi:hypothetical protein ACOSQ4_018341 [Xanthoceras sorbifolium]
MMGYKIAPSGRTKHISDLVSVKSIWWSRSEESARSAVEIASKLFPGVKCVWGNEGFDEIMRLLKTVPFLVLMWFLLNKLRRSLLDIFSEQQE